MRSLTILALASLAMTACGSGGAGPGGSAGSAGCPGATGGAGGGPIGPQVLTPVGAPTIDERNSTPFTSACLDNEVVVGLSVDDNASGTWTTLGVRPICAPLQKLGEVGHIGPRTHIGTPSVTRNVYCSSVAPAVAIGIVFTYGCIETACSIVGIGLVCQPVPETSCTKPFIVTDTLPDTPEPYSFTLPFELHCDAPLYLTGLAGVQAPNVAETPEIPNSMVRLGGACDVVMRGSP